MASINGSPAVDTGCSASHAAPKYPHTAAETSPDASKMAEGAESVVPKAFSPICPDDKSATGRQSNSIFGLPGRGTSGSLELQRAGSIGLAGGPDLALGRLIGRGSFGRVYKGEWQGREVAVKVLCSQDNREANFEGLSEYLVSKQVRHPNVVETYKVIIAPRSVSQQNSRPESQPSFCESPAFSRVASSKVSSAAGANSSLDSLVQFFQDSSLDSNPAPALATGAHQLAAEVAPDARQLAAASVFAAAAAAKPEAEAGTSVERHCGDSFGNEELRGILDTSGTFAESRAATLPLAPSPFEAALERALSGNVDATAEPVLQRIARCFSAADRLAAGVLAKGGPAAGGPAVGDPAACRPAAAAEHAPLRPQYRSSSLGNPTADRQSSWLAKGSSSIGSERGALQAGRSLNARPSFPGLPPRPPRAASSDDMAAMGTALVMEYADLGSLHAAIFRGRIKGNLDAVLLCARDVASGMAYLHSMDVIHSDLKPANVLLKSAQATPSDPPGFTCKIADFGMARRIAADRSHICIDVPGSLTYTAPEVLQAGKMTKAGDVYSFAVLLVELWSGCASYTDQNYYGVLYSVLCGCRPPVPADAPIAYRALLEDCWAADPGCRPTFPAIHGRLAALLAAAPEH